MFAVWLYAIVSVVTVSLISLVGLFTISMSDRMLRPFITIMVGLAVGAMFGDAFIHLLPEAFERYGATTAPALYTLAGIFLFFVLEKILHWMPVRTLNNIRPFGYLNLFADGFHNLIDGLLIGASYLVSVRLGVATTLAVVLHEIPQEVGDFGVLLDAGFSKWRALFFNFLSACTAILGTLVALFVGGNLEHFNTLMLPLTAGGFIYLAGSDLIPELHKEHGPIKSLAQLTAMIAGVCVMLLVKLFE